MTSGLAELPNLLKNLSHLIKTSKKRPEETINDVLSNNLWY